MAVTVYTKPSCVQCTATYRALDSKGIDYDVLDLSEDPAALEQVKSLGYLVADDFARRCPRVEGDSPASAAAPVSPVRRRRVHPSWSGVADGYGVGGVLGASLGAAARRGKH